jgi:hypothetical protein
MENWTNQESDNESEEERKRIASFGRNLKCVGDGYDY